VHPSRGHRVPGASIAPRRLYPPDLTGAHTTVSPRSRTRPGHGYNPDGPRTDRYRVRHCGLAQTTRPAPKWRHRRGVHPAARETGRPAPFTAGADRPTAGTGTARGPTPRAPAVRAHGQRSGRQYPERRAAAGPDPRRPYTGARSARPPRHPSLYRGV